MIYKNKIKSIPIGTLYYTSINILLLFSFSQKIKFIYRYKF